MKRSLMLAAAALTLCAGAAANAQVVISQIYGGGGNSGSYWKQDFVELHNNTANPVNITGWTIQYKSAAAGGTWGTQSTGSSIDTATVLSGTIAPWGYYLVRQAPGAGGSVDLPAADATGVITISSSGAKIALCNNSTALTDADFTGTAPSNPAIVDFVGWGSTASRFEGAAPAPGTSNTTSILRLNGGCTDANQNGSDFVLSTGGASGIQPRNSAYASYNCTGPVVEADLAVSAGNTTGSCVQSGNFTANYTFTITNNGPAAADNITANLVSATSATPSIGVNSGSYSNGIWTIPTLANGASAVLTYSANVTSPGAVRATLTASSTVTDPVASNNSATASNNSPDSTSTPKAIRASAIKTVGDVQPTANIPNSLLQFFGTQFAFGRPYVSPNGQRWIMAAENNDLPDQNAMLIVGDGDNFAIAATENVTDFGGGVKPRSFTTSTSPFDRVLFIDDAGNIAFSCLDNAVTPANGLRTVVRGAAGANLGDFTWTIVAHEGDPASAQAIAALGRGAATSTLWGSQMYAAGINGANVAFYANVTGSGPNVPNNANEVLIDLNGAVLVAESVTVPTGQAGGTTFPFMGATSGNDADAIQQQASSTDTAYQGRGYKRTANSLHWATEGVIGRSATPTPALSTADQVLVVDGAVVLQEGGLIPGFTGSDTIVSIDNNSLTRFNSLAEDGTWYAYGTNAVVAPATRGTSWLVKGNGPSAPVLVAKTGDPIYPGSLELWSGAVSTQTFLGVAARGNDSIIWGLTNMADTSRDAVVVWRNGTNGQVILREGDPIDIGPVGGPANIVYCSSFIDTNRGYIDNNRNAIMVVETRNSQWPCTLAAADTTAQVIVKIPLPAVTVNCPSLASQSGNQTIACNGTANFSVTLNDAGAATYRWRRNGVDLNNGPLVIASGATVTISGATSASLSIAGVRNGNHGDLYDCVVTTNTPSCTPSFTSAVRLLRVLPVCKCNPADVAGLGGIPGADGQLTADDIVYYLNRFFANDTAVADLVGLGGNPVLDNAVTVDDLVYFLDQFFRPCNP